MSRAASRRIRIPLTGCAEMRVRKEVKQGVQMIQYQVITLMTTNGQAPFITVFMYLDEVPEGPMRDDLAMVTRKYCGSGSRVSRMRRACISPRLSRN